MSIRIVAEVTPETMDGDNALEKEINAYLTRHFILTRNVPADECLDEARAIIEMMRKYEQDRLLEIMKEAP